MSFSAQQLTMFGVPANPEFAFHVFHDESGTYVPSAGDRWLLHGVLFVPEVKRGEERAEKPPSRREQANVYRQMWRLPIVRAIYMAYQS